MHPLPVVAREGVRVSLVSAAVADAIRTSLGPRGMDKMVLSTQLCVSAQSFECTLIRSSCPLHSMHAVQIQNASGDVTITNDGATILKEIQVLHPAARMVRGGAAVHSMVTVHCVL